MISRPHILVESGLQAGSVIGSLVGAWRLLFRSSSASFSSSPESVGWMHVVIQRVMRDCAGEFMRREEAPFS